METRDVELELDTLDYSDTQTRAALDQDAIDHYAEILRNGGKLDPALVFQEGDRYWPATGKHRFEAHRRVGRTTMRCEIRAGGKADAIVAGCQDNERHRGVRLTRADR